MPTINSLQDFRQQYPMYNDLSDAEVVAKLHSKFYSNIPLDDLQKRLGYEPGMWGTAKEAGRSFVKGVGEGQPADMLSPQQADKARAAVGQPPSSPPQQPPGERPKWMPDEPSGHRGFLSSTVPRFVGHMVGGGPGGAAMWESAAARAATAAAPRAAELGAGRTPGEVMQAQRAGTWTGSRALDREAAEAGRGSLGLRGVPGAAAAESVVGALPGGGRVARATAQAETARAQDVAEIAENLRITSHPEEIRALLANPEQDEQLFQSLLNSNTNSHTAAALIRQANSYGRYSRQLMAANALDRMGRVSLDVPWRAETFLANWSRMNPAVADAYFGRAALGQNYAENMRTLIANIQRLEPYTGLLRSGAATVGHTRLPTQVGSWTEMAAAIWGLIHGNLRVLRGVGLVYTGTRAVSWALTNPKAVQWLAAQTTKMVARTAATTGEQEAAPAPVSDMQSDFGDVAVTGRKVPTEIRPE